MSELRPFEVLFERDGLHYQLPAELEKIYGKLGFGSPVVYGNFVSSIDGVVSLGSVPSAGSVVSGRNPADRFLMGLLRACADAVLLGAGTLRATPGHLWTAEHVAPDFAPQFAELRRTLGRDAKPRLVVVTSRGDFDISHPAIQAGATVVTSSRQARALRSRLPPSCDVMEAGDGERVEMTRAMEQLSSRGWKVLLTEGGPHLIGEIIAATLLDEIFLTISPVIAGRAKSERLGMVAGHEFLPADGRWSELLSARRNDDYLFLRYRFKRG